MKTALPEDIADFAAVATKRLVPVRRTAGRAAGRDRGPAAARRPDRAVRPRGIRPRRPMLLRGSAGGRGALPGCRRNGTALPARRGAAGDRRRPARSGESRSAAHRPRRPGRRLGRRRPRRHALPGAAVVAHRRQARAFSGAGHVEPSPTARCRQPTSICTSRWGRGGSSARCSRRWRSPASTCRPDAVRQTAGGISGCPIHHRRRLRRGARASRTRQVHHQPRWNRLRRRCVRRTRWCFGSRPPIPRGRCCAPRTSYWERWVSATSPTSACSTGIPSR